MKSLNLYSDKLPRQTRGSFAYWGLAILVACLYAVLSGLTPLAYDDWTFMGNWRDDAMGGYEFSFSAWKRYYFFIRDYDNGRIANALSPFSTMFSPWKELFPVFTGFLLAGSIVVLQRLSSSPSRKYSPFWLALTWILIIVALPWRNNLFVRDYSLNYIWGTAVTLVFLLLLRRVCTSPKSNIGSLVACFILAFLAGGWHEGFAVPTLFGLALLALVRRFRLPPLFYILSVVYLLSTLLFMLSPGLMGRARDAVGHDHTFPSLRVYFIVIVDVILLILLLLTRRRFRMESRDISFLTVSSGILVAGFLLGMFTTGTPRSYFWPDMAATGIAVRLSGYLLSSSSRIPSFARLRLLMPATILLIVVSTMQTLGTIYWQYRYSREAERIVELIRKSKSGSVFYDVTLPPHAPFYTLDIPVAHLWQSGFNAVALQSYFMTPMLGVVPTRLSNFTYDKAQPVEGSRPAVIYEGLIVAPFERLDTTASAIMPVSIKADFQLPQRHLEGYFLATPFITEKGDTLLHYLPL